MYLTDSSIEARFLFQRSTCSHTFERYHHYLRRPFAVVWYFQGYCVSFMQALAVILFFIGIELIQKSTCSHPCDELPFFYYKRVITATHSFKFTVLLQNKNCSKEMLTITIIPPWFQACIYWKKFVIWQHQFQPSIFSMMRSLFHGSTWSNLHVKETVFSQHFLQASILISGLWLIREKVEEYVYLKIATVALLF